MRDAKLAALAALPVEQVADLIGMPLQGWAGNCYAVAVALVESGLLPSGTEAVYGHWRGKIAPTSTFAARRSLGFTGHGWAQTPDGQVIDPTRWAFEDVAPYVYFGAAPEDSVEEVCRNCGHLEDEHECSFGGRCAGGDNAGYDCGDCYFEAAIAEQQVDDDRCYDQGGNQLTAQRRGPYPGPPDAGEKLTTTCVPGIVTVALKDYADVTGQLSIPQAMWVANFDPNQLGPAAKDLYTWLDECDLSGLVPIDNRMAVLGGAPRAA